jgi:hypothetical protein
VLEKLPAGWFAVVDPRLLAYGSRGRYVMRFDIYTMIMTI